MANIYYFFSQPPKKTRKVVKKLQKIEFSLKNTGFVEIICSFPQNT
jgi:hypothetical protein